MTRIGLLGIFFCSYAHAADTAQLAVVGIHSAELTALDQEQLVTELVEVIDASGKVKGIHGSRVAASIQGREEIILRQALLGDGNQALQNGKNLYNQALPEDAIPALEIAIEQLEQGIVAANATKDLWEAYVYLGTSHQSLDHVEAAEAAFRSAAALSPSRAPNPALFPPFVTEAFNQAHADLAAAATQLVVTIADSDATVFLDGEDKGKGSITITDVLPGRHYLLARGGGKQAFTVLDIPAPSSDDEAPAPEAPPPDPTEEQPPIDGTQPPASGGVEVTLELGIPVLGTAGATPIARARQTTSLYRTLGEHSDNVDLFLLAGVTDEEWLHLQLYAPSADTFSKQIEIRYGGKIEEETIQALPLLLNVLDKNGYLPTASTVPTAAPLDIGTNAQLATLLTQPRPPAAGGGSADNAKKGVKAWAVIAGVVATGAVAGGGYGAYSLLTKDNGTGGTGTVIVGPF